MVSLSVVDLYVIRPCLSRKFCSYYMPYRLLIAWAKSIVYALVAQLHVGRIQRRHEVCLLQVFF